MPETPVVRPEAVDHVRGWTRAALAIEAGREPAAAGAPRCSPAELLEAVRRHRVADLLAPHTATLAVPAATAEGVAQLRAAGRRMLMVQILETGRVYDALAAAGVDALVFKGATLAVQTAGDPGARGPGDIDLLVAPERIRAAHAVLLALGWTPRPTSRIDPGTWAWRHAVRAFNSFTYDGPGTSIDLHWRLDPTHDALPTFAEAWSRREQVDLGGIVVPTLARPDAFAHTCLHSAKDFWRWLRSLVDVHRLAGLEETWAAGRPLRRLEASTLAVTRSSIGLPAAVPAAVGARLDAVPAAVLARARSAQDGPAEIARRLPGLVSAQQLRSQVEASATPRDLMHSAARLLLPVRDVVGVQARSGWLGVPLTLWHRLRQLLRRPAS